MGIMAKGETRARGIKSRKLKPHRQKRKYTQSRRKKLKCAVENSANELAYNNAIPEEDVINGDFSTDLSDAHLPLENLSEKKKTDETQSSHCDPLEKMKQTNIAVLQTQDSQDSSDKSLDPQDSLGDATLCEEVKCICGNAAEPIQPLKNGRRRRRKKSVPTNKTCKVHGSRTCLQSELNRDKLKSVVTNIGNHLVCDNAFSKKDVINGDFTIDLKSVDMSQKQFENISKMEKEDKIESYPYNQNYPPDKAKPSNISVASQKSENLSDKNLDPQESNALLCVEMEISCSKGAMTTEQLKNARGKSQKRAINDGCKIHVSRKIIELTEDTVHEDSNQQMHKLNVALNNGFENRTFVKGKTRNCEIEKNGFESGTELKNIQATHITDSNLKELVNENLNPQINVKNTALEQEKGYNSMKCILPQFPCSAVDILGQTLQVLKRKRGRPRKIDRSLAEMIPLSVAQTNPKDVTHHNGDTRLSPSTMVLGAEGEDWKIKNRYYNKGRSKRESQELNLGSTIETKSKAQTGHTLELDASFNAESIALPNGHKCKNDNTKEINTVEKEQRELEKSSLVQEIDRSAEVESTVNNSVPVLVATAEKSITEDRSLSTKPNALLDKSVEYAYCEFKTDETQVLSPASLEVGEILSKSEVKGNTRLADKELNYRINSKHGLLEKEINQELMKTPPKRRRLTAREINRRKCKQKRSSWSQGVFSRRSNKVREKINSNGISLSPKGKNACMSIPDASSIEPVKETVNQGNDLIINELTSLNYTSKVLETENIPLIVSREKQPILNNENFVSKIETSIESIAAGRSAIEKQRLKTRRVRKHLKGSLPILQRQIKSKQLVLTLQKSSEASKVNGANHEPLIYEDGLVNQENEPNVNGLKPLDTTSKVSEIENISLTSVPEHNPNKETLNLQVQSSVESSTITEESTTENPKVKRRNARKSLKGGPKRKKIKLKSKLHMSQLKISSETIKPNNADQESTLEEGTNRLIRKSLNSTSEEVKEIPRTDIVSEDKKTKDHSRRSAAKRRRKTFVARKPIEPKKIHSHSKNEQMGPLVINTHDKVNQNVTDNIDEYQLKQVRIKVTRLEDLPLLELLRLLNERVHNEYLKKVVQVEHKVKVNKSKRVIHSEADAELDKRNSNDTAKDVSTCTENRSETNVVHLSTKKQIIGKDNLKDNGTQSLIQQQLSLITRCNEVITPLQHVPDEIFDVEENASTVPEYEQEKQDCVKWISESITPDMYYNSTSNTDFNQTLMEDYLNPSDEVFDSELMNPLQGHNLISSSKSLTSLLNTKDGEYCQDKYDDKNEQDICNNDSEENISLELRNEVKTVRSTGPFTDKDSRVDSEDDANATLMSHTISDNESVLYKEQNDALNFNDTSFTPTGEESEKLPLLSEYIANRQSPGAYEENDKIHQNESGSTISPKETTADVISNKKTEKDEEAVSKSSKQDVCDSSTGQINDSELHSSNVGETPEVKKCLELNEQHSPPTDRVSKRKISSPNSKRPKKRLKIISNEKVEFSEILKHRFITLGHNERNYNFSSSEKSETAATACCKNSTNSEDKDATLCINSDGTSSDKVVPVSEEGKSQVNGPAGGNECLKKGSCHPGMGNSSSEEEEEEDGDDESTETEGERTDSKSDIEEKPSCENQKLVRKWRCHLCNEKFALLRNYYRHKYYSHKDESSVHVCDNCTKVITSVQMVNIHVCTNVTSWRCKRCNRNFCNSLSLMQHNKRYHFETLGPHKCNMCELKFLTNCMLERHKTVQHPIETSSDVRNRLPFVKSVRHSYFSSSKVCETTQDKILNIKQENGRLTIPRCIQKLNLENVFLLPNTDEAKQSRTKNLGITVTSLGGKTEYCCELCNLMHLTKSEIKLHLTEKHNVSVRTCELCDDFYVFTRAINHLIERHIVFDNSSLMNKKSFNRPDTTLAEGDTPFDLRKVLGEKRFAYLQRYRQLYKMRRDQYLFCETCLEEYLNIDGYIFHHLKMHDSCCILCNVEFENSQQALYHKIGTHNSISSYLWAIRKIISVSVVTENYSKILNNIAHRLDKVCLSESEESRNSESTSGGDKNKYKHRADYLYNKVVELKNVYRPSSKPNISREQSATCNTAVADISLPLTSDADSVDTITLNNVNNTEISRAALQDKPTSFSTDEIPVIVVRTEDLEMYKDDIKALATRMHSLCNVFSEDYYTKLLTVYVTHSSR